MMHLIVSDSLKVISEILNWWQFLTLVSNQETGQMIMSKQLGKLFADLFSKVKTKTDLMVALITTKKQKYKNIFIVSKSKK